ncbi:hypothetical protein KEJ24_03650 [Candidatus Bathyarchaeota archaeon]|nr:hypothetical protein [Candidatus Bathyarchaeota archaeon]
MVFRRYIKGKPLTVKEVRDFQELLRAMNFQVRTIYASANKYRSVNNVGDVRALSNVARCTPTWDVNSKLSNWQETIAVAKRIIAFLENEGVKDSVYIKWSGNGCHIHIHEEAISEDALNGAHPLDLAYAIVEYVNLHALPKISEKLCAGNIRVENRMDAGRVFTCPLSFHRKLNVVCVCLKPNKVDSFSTEWIQPKKFKHNPAWRNFKKREADALATKAYESIGGYIGSWRGKKPKNKRLDKQINEWLRKF